MAEDRHGYAAQAARNAAAALEALADSLADQAPPLAPATCDAEGCDRPGDWHRGDLLLCPLHAVEWILGELDEGERRQVLPDPLDDHDALASVTEAACSAALRRWATELERRAEWHRRNSQGGPRLVGGSARDEGAAAALDMAARGMRQATDPIALHPDPHDLGELDAVADPMAPSSRNEGER